MIVQIQTTIVKRTLWCQWLRSSNQTGVKKTNAMEQSTRAWVQLSVSSTLYIVVLRPSEDPLCANLSFSTVTHLLREPAVKHGWNVRGFLRIGSSDSWLMNDDRFRKRGKHTGKHVSGSKILYIHVTSEETSDVSGSIIKFQTGLIYSLIRTPPKITCWCALGFFLGF